ncbi:MAG: EAL domain-containing protein [Pseudomonadota bacterium]
MAFRRLADVRFLWVRYALGILLLIGLMLGGHQIHLQSLREGVTDAATIDISGRQRMLSQRLTAFAHKLNDPVQRPAYAAATHEALDLFETSHGLLLARQAAFPSAADVYAVGAPDGLDARSRAFVADMRMALQLAPGDPRFFELLARLDSTAFAPLLRQLDAAVKAITADAEARLGRLGQLQALLLELSLGLLVFEALLIFWPAQRAVNQAMRTAKDRAADLAHRNRDLQALSDRLEYSALHDPLTGLANRKKLYAELERRLQRSAPCGPTCVMHVDLDRFKEINDTLGHAVGDMVLKRAAEAMKSKLHKDDLVARVGGDEFVIVVDLESADPLAQAQRIAEGVIARIREPMLIDENSCTVGASVGYALIGTDRTMPERIVADADIALYEAKRDGKGKAKCFTPRMRNGVERRHALIQDLQRALDANEFVAYLQPKIAFSDGRITGFEALTRWLHPARGVLPPADFLDLAEEIGATDLIDRQAALGGVDALAAMRARGWQRPTLALNASAKALRGSDYAADLRMAMAMRSLAPGDIRIEVVEHTLISDTGDKAIATLRALTADGFRIDIDDFGTGYASLSMLSKLDLAGVKIDRELVGDIENDRSRQVIAAIVGLAKGLNLEIIAEGVETQRQFAQLRALGCDTAQGFGVGKPMSREDALAWLDQHGNQPVVDLTTLEAKSA